MLRMNSTRTGIIYLCLIPLILLFVVFASLYFMPNHADPELDLKYIPKLLKSELIYKRYVTDSDRFYVYKLSGHLLPDDRNKWQTFTVKYREFMQEIRQQAQSYINDEALCKPVDDFLFYRLVKEDGKYLFPTKNRTVIYLPEEQVGFLFFIHAKIAHKMKWACPSQ